MFKNAELKDEFLQFLKNVYNIYPETGFHNLISNLVNRNNSDQEINKALLSNLHTIKPWSF